jgi:hypothetical protein
MQSFLPVSWRAVCFYWRKEQDYQLWPLDMAHRARKPELEAERQLKVAVYVMGRFVNGPDREILRTLAERPEDTPAISVEKTTESSRSQLAGHDDETQERD